MSCPACSSSTGGLIPRLTRFPAIPVPVPTTDPDEAYGISAEEDVYLKGVSVVASEHLLSGWAANHVGFLEHESQALSSDEFLTRIQEFLRGVDLTTVISAKLDAEVYGFGDDPQGNFQ